ncbi:MAG: sulfurtransferase-like selenium metabolism protein YedF [Spirochaetota bacterium]
MSRKTVDARGLACPKPIIMARKAIQDNGGDGFILLIDNETSRSNVERFLADNSIPFTTSAADGVFSITVSTDGNRAGITDPAEYCTLPEESAGRGTSVVCITGRTMGTGDDELGTILMKGFVNTLPQLDPLPETVILYNGGVFLAADGSPVLAALAELEEKGVRMLVCGTCADFYAIKDSVAVGIISNMYEIAETLNSAGRVICP